MNHSMFSFQLIFIAVCVHAKKPVVTIPLAKQHVPVKNNNRTVMNKTAYFGTVSVGQPEAQHFTVVFDTGSGHLMLPSVDCHSSTCKQHKQFDSALSHTAAQHNNDNVEILYGTGEVTGSTVNDVVCLTDENHMISSHESSDLGLKVRSRPDETENTKVCIEMKIVSATEMTDQPFSAFDFDGVLGLGLQSLAVGPRYSFLGQVAKHSEVPRIFAVFISEDDSTESEISFGGFNDRRMVSPLTWVPVNNPDLGYWQVRIKSVSIGGVHFSFCDDGTCIAILDSGTSSMGVPKTLIQDIHYPLVRQLPSSSDENLAENIDCRNVEGPTFEFHLEGMSIVLDAKDYSRPAHFHGNSQLLSSRSNFSRFAQSNASSEGNEMAAFCRATLLPVVMEEPMPANTFILGEPALRKYYTAYDWGEQMVGFAMSSQSITI